jgi:hypothetical protein
MPLSPHHCFPELMQNGKKWHTGLINEKSSLWGKVNQTKALG